MLSLHVGQAEATAQRAPMIVSERQSVVSLCLRITVFSLRR
jgi:hypothetical protein